MTDDLQKREASLELRQKLAHSEEYFECMLRMAMRSLQVSAGAIAMVGLERQYLRVQSGLVAADDRPDVAFFAAPMLGREPLVVGDLREHTGFNEHPLVTGPSALRFYAGVGIHDVQGLPAGAVTVVDARPRQLTPETLEPITQTLGDLAGLVEHEFLMRSLTRSDPLTGLLNSSYAALDIEREWRRASRARHPVTMLMLNVDRLGNYNDVFGYPAGDRALREVAERLGMMFRRSEDQLLRLGGDRILALLPNTQASEAAMLAENARAQVELLGLGDADAGTRITLSIGCATAQRSFGHADGWQALIRRADSALKQAKRSGRNRVVTYGD